MRQRRRQQLRYSFLATYIQLSSWRTNSTHQVSRTGVRVLTIRLLRIKWVWTIVKKLGTIRRANNLNLALYLITCNTNLVNLKMVASNQMRGCRANRLLSLVKKGRNKAKNQIKRARKRRFQFRVPLRICRCLCKYVPAKIEQLLTVKIY